MRLRLVAIFVLGLHCCSGAKRYTCTDIWSGKVPLDGRKIIIEGTLAIGRHHGTIMCGGNDASPPIAISTYPEHWAQSAQADELGITRLQVGICGTLRESPMGSAFRSTAPMPVTTLEVDERCSELHAVTVDAGAL